jgi:hypothetical protein
MYELMPRPFRFGHLEGSFQLMKHLFSDILPRY